MTRRNGGPPARSPGYVLVWRRSTDDADPYWSARPFDRWRARLDLILDAAWRDETVRESLVAGQVVLARGEVLVSAGLLARRWGWPVGRVRRFFAELEADGFLVEVRSAGPRGTVCRLPKYDFFQRRPEVEEP